MTQIFTETALTDAISKLGSMVLAMSVTPGASCAPGVPCLGGACYACKHAYNVYPNVREAWDRNFRLALIGDFKQISGDIQSTLDTGRYPYFRWFVGGDIPNMGFLHMMCGIADRNPDIKFLCFTKKFDMVEEYISGHEIPSNLTMVLSCWKDWRPTSKALEAFPRSYFNDGTPECDLPYISFQCSGDCVECGHQCWDMAHHDNVIFNKH